MTALLDAEEELSTEELAAELGAPAKLLTLWVYLGILAADQDRDGGSGYPLRWTSAQAAGAKAVFGAYQLGFHRRVTLRRVAEAVRVADGRPAVRCDWPELTVIVDPVLAADLEPLDRPTLVVVL